MRFDRFRQLSWLVLSLCLPAVAIVAPWSIRPAVALAQPSDDDRGADEAPAPPQESDDSPAADEPQEMSEEPAELPDLAEQPDEGAERPPLQILSETAEPAQLEEAAELAEPLPEMDARPVDVQEADEPEMDDGLPIETQTLKGVQPGVTTRAELHTHWGEPLRVERIAGGARELFRVAGFDRVRATIIEDVVDSIAVQLSKPAGVEWLVNELKLGDVEAVELWDDEGRLTGQAYPERGVMFGFELETKPVVAVRVVLHAVDDEAFLARAENRLRSRYADCLADLKTALQLNPSSGRAHWIHAQLTRQTGDLDEAIKSIGKAVELEPNELEYRLTLARVLAETGRHAEAIAELRGVIADAKATPLILAKAYSQWGDCMAMGPKADYAAAIKLHIQAIKLAEPLSGSAAMPIRRAAKELMVETHLAVAHDVGLGRWQQKSAAASKWLEKAARLADEVVVRDRGNPQLKLRVYEEALGALVGIATPPDAGAWIRGATQLGASALEEAVDPTYKSRVAWQLAVALCDAVEIEHARDRLPQTVELCKLAMACFDQGALVGRNSTEGEYLRGRVMYRIGAVEAIERSDHQSAVAWFDQALPLLERTDPASAHTGKHGEMLVSMAISYWQVDKRSQAMRLTERGAKLMEQAAADGLLSKPALAVPYNNLATMHEKLGRDVEAKKYSVMAASFEEKATGTKRKKPVIIQGSR
jgi:tetratricopeptide (TPR) repeat protein